MKIIKEKIMKINKKFKNYKIRKIIKFNNKMQTISLILKKILKANTQKMTQKTVILQNKIISKVNILICM